MILFPQNSVFINYLISFIHFSANFIYLYSRIFYHQISLFLLSTDYYRRKSINSMKNIS